MSHFEPSHRKRASEAQLRYLKQLGVFHASNINQRDACELIEEAKRGREWQPATDKQKWRLQHANLWQEGMTRTKASELIARLYADENCTDGPIELPYGRRPRRGQQFHDASGPSAKPPFNPPSKPPFG